MASSSSTADELRHRHHDGVGSIPSPPPPTPSNHSSSAALPTTADDALSRLLQQLLITPTLSLSNPPRRRRTSSAAPNPSPTPLISLLHRQQDLLLSAASDLGFFHLTDHGIPSHLPTSAVVEAQSLLHSTDSSLSTRTHSTLGFNRDEDDDEEDAHMVFDAGTGDLDDLPALGEYARCLEKVGMEVVEMLSGTAMGFSENPFRNGSMRPRCLMWVSSSSSAPEVAEEMRMGCGESKSYPYVVCLQYEMREWRKPCWVLGDSVSWTSVASSADSLLVTIGDIAQVWSNGKFKKVRGMPQPNSCENFNNRTAISLSLLVTLPMDSVVSPLPLPGNCDGCDADEGDTNKKEFRAFPFDEYAWRVRCTKLYPHMQRGCSRDNESC